MVPRIRGNRKMMTLHSRILSIAFMVAFGVSCASEKMYLKEDTRVKHPVAEGLPDYTVYGVGDVGEINEKSKAVMAQLAKEASDDIQPGMVIFLGDNIYPAGFPPEWSIEAHHKAQDILMNQVHGLANSTYQGQIIFIPGNHDWNEFNPGGLDAIRRQGDFLADLNDSRVMMLPKNGCGGPVILELNSDAIIVIIDSQWWLQDWTVEPAINEGCEIQSREDFVSSFHKTIATHVDKQIVVALHHPLNSQGPHGGHFTIRDHLFPLTKVVRWLYLPLPVIGSIYPYYRSLFGHPQDIKGQAYTALKKALLNDLDYNGELIFLSGHEHTLQYITDQGNHFIISGAGAKQNAVTNSKNLIYGHKAVGFIQMDFYQEKGVKLTVYEVDPALASTKMVFSRFIVNLESK